MTRPEIWLMFAKVSVKSLLREYSDDTVAAKKSARVADAMLQQYIERFENKPKEGNNET